MGNVCLELDKISSVALNQEMKKTEKTIESCEKGKEDFAKKPKIRQKFEELCQELTTKYNCLHVEWRRREGEAIELREVAEEEDL